MKIEDVVTDAVTNRVRVGWAFVGFFGDPEKATPIGVYSCYADGAAVANAWMKNTPKAVRWEGMPIHEELEDDD